MGLRVGEGDDGLGKREKVVKWANIAFLTLSDLRKDESAINESKMGGVGLQVRCFWATDGGRSWIEKGRLSFVLGGQNKTVQQYS